MLGSLLRFKTGLRSLAGIERQLTRIADLYEHQMAHEGIYVKAPKPEEVVVLYTDEERDAELELQERIGKKVRLTEEQEW